MKRVSISLAVSGLVVGLTEGVGEADGVTVLIGVGPFVFA